MGRTIGNSGIVGSSIEIKGSKWYEPVFCPSLTVLTCFLLTYDSSDSISNWFVSSSVIGFFLYDINTMHFAITGQLALEGQSPKPGNKTGRTSRNKSGRRSAGYQETRLPQKETFARGLHISVPSIESLSHDRTESAASERSWGGQSMGGECCWFKCSYYIK